MTLLRTTAELTQALESMYRVHAVEEPPDARGVRAVWHRGAIGAALLSVVDADGMVLRHELQLFAEVVVWERGGPLKTGVAREAQGAGRAKAHDDVRFDGAQAVGARAAGLHQALQGYQGDDRYLAHLRARLAEVVEAQLPEFDEQVTRPASQVSKELRRELAAARSTARSARRRPWLVAGALLALAAAGALFFFTR